MRSRRSQISSACRPERRLSPRGRSSGLIWAPLARPHSESCVSEAIDYKGHFFCLRNDAIFRRNCAIIVRGSTNGATITRHPGGNRARTRCHGRSGVVGPGRAGEKCSADQPACGCQYAALRAASACVSSRSFFPACVNRYWVYPVGSFRARPRPRRASDNGVRSFTAFQPENPLNFYPGHRQGYNLKQSMNLRADLPCVLPSDLPCDLPCVPPG